MTLRFRLSLVFLALLTACGHASAPKVAETAATPAVAPDRNAEDDIVIPIGPRDAVRGSRDALITLVVFSDFQCPFCARVGESFDRLRKEYGSQDLRIVWKNKPLPMHENARLAAEMGQGVLETKGQDAFWRFHDTVFAHPDQMSPESLRAWARAAGADGAAIDTGLTKKTWAAKVEADLALADQLGVTGTPTVFINGVLMVGAQPYDQWKSLVDAELAKAKALVAEGTSRDRIYRVLVTKNLEAGPPKDDQNADKGEDARVWYVPVAGAPSRGGASALVTLVEFCDFQCPFCKRVQPTLEQIRTAYGDKVRFVWRDLPLPFHPRANPAAQLARFAHAQKSDMGWAVRDLLFASQNLEDADLEAIARAAGLDVKKAMSAVKNKTFQKDVEADEDLAEDVQARGTPHFFINGHRFVGAQPFENFKKVIDEEMAKAENLLKSGVSATALYDTIIKDGVRAPEPEQKTAAPPAEPAPFMGAAKGTVVIQGWSDFQCPFCARVEATLDELVKDYPTQVKIVWRDMPLPFHLDAPLAAEAAREAFAQKGNLGFAKMRKLLFANQHTEGGLQRPALESYAKKIGLNLSKFKSALDDRTHKAAIDAESTAGMNAGIRETPSFLIGPYYLSGAQPLPRFKRLVVRVLDSAKANAP